MAQKRQIPRKYQTADSVQMVGKQEVGNPIRSCGRYTAFPDFIDRTLPVWGSVSQHSGKGPHRRYVNTTASARIDVGAPTCRERLFRRLNRRQDCLLGEVGFTKRGSAPRDIVLPPRHEDVSGFATRASQGRAYGRTRRVLSGSECCAWQSARFVHKGQASRRKSSEG